MLPLDFHPPLLARFNRAMSSFPMGSKKLSFNKKIYASVEEGGLGCPRIDYGFSLSQLSKSNLSETYALPWGSNGE